MTTEPNLGPMFANPSAPAEPMVSASLPGPTPPSAKRSKVAIGGVALGVMGLIGGGVFAAQTLAGPSSNTPSEAVQQMTKAVAAGDVIAAMESLAPGERDVLLQSGVPLLEQLKRLDVLKSDLDLKAVKGATISFAGQTYTEVPVRDDIVNVNVKGGTYRLNADMQNLPIGSWLRKNMGEDAQRKTTVSEERTLGGKGASLTTVKSGDRWYVSLLYTGAEQARASAGLAVPAQADRIPANGADSAEGAVKAMLDAAAGLDARRMVELMPPDELSVLHDYSPLFLTEAEKAAVKGRAQFSLTFPNLGMKTDGTGDTVRVSITRWSADLRLKSVDGPESKVLLDGDCITATLNGETKQRCGKDAAKLLSDFKVVDSSVELDKMGSQFSASLSKSSAAGSFTVVKRDGKWYVSPERTALDTVTDRLAKVTKGDIDKLKQQYTTLLDDVLGASLD